MKGNQSCFQGRISVSLHHKIILTSLVCLAQLPWHRVPTSLWSFTHEETCCSHCSSLGSSFTSASCRKPGSRQAGLCTSLCLHIGPGVVAVVFPPSEGQMCLHMTSEDWPTYNLLSQRSYQETHKSPSSYKLSFQPSFWVLLFSPVIGSKNSATFPRAFLTGRILFSS